MKLVLKEVGILSSAKMSMILSGLFGIFIGLIYGVLLFAVVLANEKNVGLAILVGVLFIIGFPLLYAGFGFVSGAVFAWLYNLLAPKIGGIEMTFEKS